MDLRNAGELCGAYLLLGTRAADKLITTEPGCNHLNSLEVQYCRQIAVHFRVGSLRDVEPLAFSPYWLHTAASSGLYEDPFPASITI